MLSNDSVCHCYTIRTKKGLLVISTLLALILILTGLSIIADTGREFWSPHPIPKPDILTLWIALLAIVINELLFRYSLFISKKINSALLAANAWHSRSDAGVSIIVVLSILGALGGFPYLDSIGAIIVGIIISKLGINLGWKSISELVDTGVEKTLSTIQSIIKDVPGVTTLHQLRTRTINNLIFVDVHILVSPRISVSEGHFIGDEVIVALKKIPDISDITVHVDPEDDEMIHRSVALPSREALMLALKHQWANLPILDPSKDIRLHYLNGKIDIEILLPLKFKAYSEDYQKIKQDLNYINRIDVLFSEG